jgi:hypothetical protein
MLFLFKCGLASKAGLRHLSWNNSGGSATVKHINRVKILLSTGILLIYGFTSHVEVEMPFVPKGVLMGLSFFIPNFLRMS